MKSLKDAEYKQPHYLVHMLQQLQKNVPINYNQYKFQRKGANIQTCGSRPIIRSLFDNMPLDISLQ